MNRTDYQTKRRELRRQLHIPCPPEEEMWRQPLARAHWADHRREVCEQLHRLQGGGYKRTTARQAQIELLVKYQAKRNAHRAALKALREAGADEGDVRRADNNIRFYGAQPEHYLRRAAELMGMR